MTRTAVALLAASVVALVGCGAADGSSPTTTTPDVATPTTTSATTTTMAPPIVVESEAGVVELPAPASRIAALSATHVEMLFAMEAGDQVIAGDLFSSYPPAAAGLTLLDSFNLSVEAVIDLEPDLVILSFDPGDAVAALDAVGIPVLLFSGPSDLDGVYAQILTLGAAAGHGADAAALVERMQDDIADAVAAVGDRGVGVTFYHESDSFSFYTPNSASFLGRLYALLGMENIADAAPDEFGTGFPQLSPEYIIEADPDVVFVGSFGEDGDTLAARDGWNTMSAVAADRVFVVDVDESSRWGPRIVDFLEDVADALLSLDPDGG